MAKLSHKIHINAPKERIHQALSAREGLKNWFTPHIEGDVRQDETAVFRFTDKEPFRWKFVEIKPPSLVRWECLEGPSDARGTTVTFRFSDKGDGRTVVECDQEGWSEKHEAFHICNTFWGMPVGHLRNYAESTERAAAFS